MVWPNSLQNFLESGYVKSIFCINLCVHSITDGDWLEAVATSRHPSPNHDLCCRLLAHIPLLAAYTGWPTEYHLHVNSQAGTPLFQTTNDNGSINPTERANSDVAGLNSEDHQRVNWRPSEKDKKYIEETVRSLVDREDLCRLLMVAMATELERPTSLEYEDDSCCTAEKSLRHVVQSSVDSLPGDRDHGDASTTHGVPAYKHEEPSSLQQFCGLQKSSAALGDIGEQLMENVEYGLDEVGTDAVVFEDGKSESLGAVSSTSSSTNSTSALRAEIGVQETHSGELIGNNSVWLSPKSCDKDSEKSPRRFLQTSNSLGVELRDAIRTMENAELTEFEQACSKLNSQTSYNPSHWTAVAQTADNKNTTWCSRSSLAQNLEALSISATNTSHADSHVQLSVKPQSRTTELHLQPANYTLDSGVNAKEFDDGNISSTEPHRLFDLYNEKEEKHTDGFDHYDYSVKAVLGFQLMENRIKSLAEGDRDGTEEEPQSARRTGELMADECIG